MEKQFLEFKFPLFSGKMGADVVEQEASKAEGLKRLCQYYGIDMEQTIAFGDSMNDYEIICAAGIGVARGNSVNELKAAADYVTDDIDPVSYTHLDVYKRQIEQSVEFMNILPEKIKQALIIFLLLVVLLSLIHI